MIQGDVVPVLGHIREHRMRNARRPFGAANGDAAVSGAPAAVSNATAALSNLFSNSVDGAGSVPIVEDGLKVAHDRIDTARQFLKDFSWAKVSDLNKSYMIVAAVLAAASAGLYGAKRLYNKFFQQPPRLTREQERVVDEIEDYYDDDPEGAVDLVADAIDDVAIHEANVDIPGGAWKPTKRPMSKSDTVHIANNLIQRAKNARRSETPMGTSSGFSDIAQAVMQGFPSEAVADVGIMPSLLGLGITAGLGGLGYGAKKLYDKFKGSSSGKIKKKKKKTKQGKGKKKATPAKKDKKKKTKKTRKQSKNKKKASKSKKR